MLAGRCALVVACLCAGAALALPAGDPTQAPPQTMVVTRDDIESTSPAWSTEGAPLPAPAPVPVPALKLTSMDVRSEVAMRYARTAVVTHVRNPANQSQEAVFRVLIPETAFISGFEMTLDGVTYKAYVKGKEEAKQIYDKAVSQGIGAAHVAVKARDSNQFEVSVNVEGNTKAKFNLTYEEMLVRRNGVYNHDINLHPGALVPALTVVVRVREAQPLSALRVPEVRTGNEIDATDTDPVNAVAVIERSADNREATITFKPDLDEQKRLMQVYAEKTKESQQSARRFSFEQPKQQEGVLGQFVVQYDVERPKNGDILVNDGYFVHFFAPESLPPLRKLVVFVLDTSGSMMDRKIVQLREAMRTILAELRPGDYFSIVEFNSGVKVHDLKEADQPDPAKRPSSYYYFSGLQNDNKPITLVPPFSATKENIEKAKIIVSRLVAAGGTNIAGALDVAIDMVRKGVPVPQGPGEAAAAGEAGNTGTTGATGATGATDASTEGPYAASTDIPETVNDDDQEEKQELESIIVFLTDGEGTVGETDPRRIVSRVTESNSGARRATIFSLAFGEDADRAFLRKLSLRSAGFMRHIYEAADAALQLRDFYRQISSPLLDHVTFVYPPDQVKEGSVTKHKFRTYYAGSEVVVAGRLQEGATELAPRVHAFCGVEDGLGKKRYEVYPKVGVGRERGEVLPLERLWVYLTIRQLLDEADAAADTADIAAAGDTAGAAKPDDHDDPTKKAKELALKYELVTPLTSLVVVKPNATNAVDTRPVDEQDRPSPSYGGLSALMTANRRQPATAGQTFGSFIPQAISAPLLPESLSADYEVADYEDNVYLPMPVMPAYLAYNTASRRQYRPQFFYSAAPGASAAFSSGLSGAPDSLALLVPARGPPAPPQHPSTPRQPPPSTTPQPQATSASLLQPYHLEKYSWAEPLLNASIDALVLQINGVNGTSILLKLTKNTDAPRGSSEAECARATDGGAGVCVYLTRCAPAAALTAPHYADIHCSVDAASQKFAGVCCARAAVDRPLAPAAAP